MSSVDERVHKLEVESVALLSVYLHRYASAYVANTCRESTEAREAYYYTLLVGELRKWCKYPHMP